MGPATPDNVRRLVDHFDRVRALLTDAHYDEARLREEFLDPFFKALGRDADNEQGLSGTATIPFCLQAKVEEKPEIRRVGGVYYTPTYIIDHIVKNTVGRPRERGRPARSTNADRCPKMQSMFA